MRISDWSSDVCSSDLPALALRARGGWLMNLDEFRALTPWSFFLPMLLAVTLGVQIANALGAALFGGDDAAEPPGGAVEAAAAENDEAPAAAAANSAQATIAANQPAPTKALPKLEPVSLRSEEH